MEKWADDVERHYQTLLKVKESIYGKMTAYIMENNCQAYSRFYDSIKPELVILTLTLTDLNEKLIFHSTQYDRAQRRSTVALDAYIKLEAYINQIRQELVLILKKLYSFSALETAFFDKLLSISVGGLLEEQTETAAEEPTPSAEEEGPEEDTPIAEGPLPPTDHGKGDGNKEDNTERAAEIRGGENCLSTNVGSDLLMYRSVLERIHRHDEYMVFRLILDDALVDMLIDIKKLQRILADESFKELHSGQEPNTIN